VTLEVKLFDVTYELDVTYVAPHYGEAEFSNIVSVWCRRKEVTTYGAFLLEYASYHDMPLEEAHRQLQDRAIEQASSWVY
jgi:hypothetical protein